MFKRGLVIIGALWMWALPAHAVPAGCFITDYDNYCYTGYFSASDCNQFNMNSRTFGSYISSMCTYVNNTENLASLAIIDRDKYAQIAVATEANRQGWIAFSANQANLIKRLRKKCGSKCKKIK